MTTTSMFVLTTQEYTDAAKAHLEANGWSVSASERWERDGVIDLGPAPVETNRHWYLSISGIENADLFNPGIEFVLITNRDDEEEGHTQLESFAHLDALLTKYGFTPAKPPTQ
jgi:hypothetical protein